MRRTLGLVIALALTAVACGDDSSAASVNGFDIVKKDTLTVVTSLPAPGFFTGDDPSKLSGGYEYEIAKEMAKRLGIAEVRFQNKGFDAIVAGQVKGYDIAMSQITITDKRKEVNQYSDPYFDSDQGIFVNKGTSVKSTADAAKLQWGVQSDTTGQDYVINTVKPSKEPKVFQDTPSMFQALLDKKIDAVLLDTAIVLPQSKAKGYENTEVVGQFKTGESYGIQLPKSSKNLAKVNELIAALKKDGTLAKLATANFGLDPTTVPVVK